MEKKDKKQKTPKTSKPIPYLVSKDGRELRLEHYWWTDPKEGEYLVHNGYVVGVDHSPYKEMLRAYTLLLVPASTVFVGTLRIVGTALGRSAANMRVTVDVEWEYRGDEASPRACRLTGDMQLVHLVSLWDNAVKGEVRVEVKAKKVGQNYLLELMSVG